jgi:hypothetical protein
LLEQRGQPPARYINLAFEKFILLL